MLGEIANTRAAKWGAADPSLSTMPKKTPVKDAGGPGQSQVVKAKPVIVSTSVLIKIARHCRDHYPGAVNGLLVGLAGAGEMLEVTDCFGLVNKQDAYSQQYASGEKSTKELDAKVAAEAQRYEARAMELLQITHADCCNVGWYQKLSLAESRDPDIVLGLFEHQEIHPDALLIGYDPGLAELGVKAFSAFRLSEEAQKLKAQATDPEKSSSLWSLVGRPLLVEVPLILKNSLLEQAFLLDWICSDEALKSAGEFDILETKDLRVEPAIEFTSACLDDLQVEQDRLSRAQKENTRLLQRHREAQQRRKMENQQRKLRNEELLPDLPAPKLVDAPSQLPLLLMAGNMRRVAAEVAKTAADDVARTFLIKADRSINRCLVTGNSKQ